MYQLAERQRVYRLKGKHKRPAPSPKSWFYPAMLHDGPGHEFAIILPTRGCSHYYSDNLGCYMCGYNNDSLGEDVDPNTLVSQFEALLQSRKEDFEKVDKIVLKIFNSGSFLDTGEIPGKAFDKICAIIKNLDNVVEIAVESRPEFITNESAFALKNAFREDQFVEVGVGLESWDDHVRQECINKDFTLEEFISAHEILSRHDVGTKVYVFLKPLFLSEKEACLDAQMTIDEVVRLAPSTISINPAAIHAGTLMEYFFDKHRYSPPKLWSVQLVVNHALRAINRSKNTLVICDPVAAGKPRGAHNCKERECNQKSLELIRNSIRENTPLEGLDPFDIDPERDCTCFLDWVDEMGF
ncbi:MAG: archaeosine biosynthesis radical SAM protein RaSEA [Promethearchaeota archaeon]